MSRDCGRRWPPECAKREGCAGWVCKLREAPHGHFLAEKPVGGGGWWAGDRGNDKRGCGNPIILLDLLL